MIYRLSMHRENGELIGYVIRELERNIEDAGANKTRINFIEFGPGEVLRIKTELTSQHYLDNLKKTNKKEIVQILFDAFG